MSTNDSLLAILIMNSIIKKKETETKKKKQQRSTSWHSREKCQMWELTNANSPEESNKRTQQWCQVTHQEEAESKNWRIHQTYAGWMLLQQLLAGPAV